MKVIAVTAVIRGDDLRDGSIDLARFLVETTKGFIRFSVGLVKTVGGPIEIAAITKHEGFKWVQRKHFFSREMNAAV